MHSYHNKEARKKKAQKGIKRQKKKNTSTLPMLYSKEFHNKKCRVTLKLNGLN